MGGPECVEELTTEHFQLGTLTLYLCHVLLEVVDGGIFPSLILGQRLKSTENAQAAAQAISHFIKLLLREVNVGRFGLRHFEMLRLRWA